MSWPIRVIAAVGMVFATTIVAHAGCIGGGGPELEAMESKAFRQPIDWLRHFETLRANPNLQSAASQAQMYLIKAEAQIQSAELEAAAQSTRSASVLLGASNESDQAIRLQILSAASLKDISAQVDQMGVIEKSIKDRPLPLGCLLYERAWSQLALGQIDRALIDLIRSNTLLHEFGKAEDKAAVQTRLAMVYQNGGDPSTSLELVDKAIDFFRSVDAKQKLGEALFVRARTLTQLKRLAAARTAVQEAITVSTLSEDQSSVGQSQLEICHIANLQGEAKQAFAYCDDAEKTLIAADLLDNEDRVILAVLRAEIAKGASVSAENLSIINKAIEKTQEKKGQLYARLLSARALIYAARGEHHLAYDDLAKSVAQIRDNAALERQNTRATLRVRFETDRAVQETRDLKAENTNAHRKLMLALILAGTAVLALFGLMRVSILNRRQHQKLTRLAEIDSLTDIPNRRKILETAKEQIEASSISGEPLIAGLIDIDFFKRVNDQYGHSAGDAVLKQFVKHTQMHLRKTDTLGRYGGEEFLLLMPDCSMTDASQVVERLRKAVADATFTTTDGQEIQFSISIGLAQVDINDLISDSLVQRADAALYAAKESGRNRIKIYDALWKKITDPSLVSQGPVILV